MNKKMARQVDRRTSLIALGTSVAATRLSCFAQQPGSTPTNVDQRGEITQLCRRLSVSQVRLRGFLVGALLGDALGGPIEFRSTETMPDDMPHVRRWEPGTIVTAKRAAALTEGLKLRSYEELRPETAPFGPWREKAPAGTITDDSRHKIIVMRAIKKSVAAAGSAPQTFDRPHLASEYLRPMRHVGPADPAVRDLDDEGFRPYRDAARWWTSDRPQKNLSDSKAELRNAGYPPERLWAGVPNCSGQMALIPLAGVFPGRPAEAYKASYAANFLDSDHAVDFCSATIAGIAEVIASRYDDQTPRDRLAGLLQTIRDTDPYRYKDIPFTGRPLLQWLQRATDWADAADADPQRLFSKLESDGDPHYWWDAHFTLLVPLAIAQFCPDSRLFCEEPLAALNLCLDFAHDTDSYAQMLGAWIGAIHGVDVFPQSMIQQVENRLKADFGESIDDWCLSLLRAAELVQNKQLTFARGTPHATR